MCTDSKTNPRPINFKMEAGFQEDKLGLFRKNCSKLLELAATDDLSEFKLEIEEKGCDIDEVSFWYGKSFGSKKMGFEERTPIMIASLYGSLEVLKYIIESRKVDLNRACGSDGATALHCAAAGGSWLSVEVVKILIDASADINVVDANGNRPGDLIPSCVKSSSNSKKKTLEMLLNGVIVSDNGDEDGSRTPRAVEKKEYPMDVSLPDINVGLYGTDEFRMYSFKVKPCSRAYSHDWTECPFVHPGENARRRDPRKYHYTCVPCPEFKKGTCTKADSCEYAHGVFESWLHPAQYRTRLCKDETGCARKVCFFAHKPDELRPLYASTGSAMPSPKSVSIGSASNITSPISPSVTCSSPMGGNMWSNKVNLITPPALQLPGSRLKTALSARDVDLDVDIIRSQQRQQLVDEMASFNLSSPYGRIGDLNPTNLDDVFGSLDPSLLSPNGFQIRQNMNQLRSSYPSNVSSSPSRKLTPYGFDSSAAVAAAVMNSRSSTFAKRSQSFIDRGGVNYHSSGPTLSSPNMIPTKLSEWGSPDGKVDWGFNGEDVSKLRKSASFGYRSGGGVNGSTAVIRSGVDEPDVSWVNSLVRDVPAGGGGPGPETTSLWFDQMYIEKEQIVA